MLYNDITIGGELYHYGVKGMKWGIRRYQPYGQGYSGSTGKFIGSKTTKLNSQGSSNSKNSKKKFKLTDNQKEIAKIAAKIAIGAGLTIASKKLFKKALFVDSEKIGDNLAVFSAFVRLASATSFISAGFDAAKKLKASGITKEKINPKEKKININKQGSIDDFNTKRDSNGIYYGRAKTRKQIDSIPGNTLTIEGVNIEKDSDRLMFKNFLERKGINTKNLNIITISGSDMNKAYNLTGNNAYQDNFHIQAFDGLNTKDPNVSVTLRSMGCRWMDDIIDNNVRREKYKRK